jgi:hypothetical protein
MTDAEHTLLRIEDDLKKLRLDASNATVVRIADYNTQDELTKFKPGWRLPEYKNLIQELHRLSASKQWQLNSNTVIKEDGYWDFSTAHGPLSRLAYVVAGRTGARRFASRCDEQRFNRSRCPVY